MIRFLHRTSAALVAAAVAFVATACGSGESRVTVDSRTTMPGASGQRSAPLVAGRDLDGNPLDLSSSKGHVVVLNVWGSWCGPCRAEAADLQRVHAEYEEREVRFVGINTRDRDVEMARKFVSDYKITFPSFYDPDGRLLLNFPPEVLNPQAIPATVLLNRRGEVAVSALRPVTDDELRTMIDAVLQEKP